MTELRIVVPDELAQRLASEGADRGASAEDVAAEVLEKHVPPHHEGKERFSFIGIGRAKPGFSVRVAEERLEAEGFG
jgi:hypothetical protein